MTLEELWEKTGDELGAMTDEQLLEFFRPYLTVTRPELADKPSRKVVPTFQNPVQALSPAKQKALALLAEEGVDLSVLNRKKRR